VSGLQTLLTSCTLICADLRYFNHEISLSVTFGEKGFHDIAPMQLLNTHIPGVNSVRYLGVYIVGNNKLSFDFAHTKRSFYAAFNNAFMHAKQIDQLIQLSHIKSYCLPLLTDVTGNLTFTQRQLRELNVCWNTVYHVIFGFSRWESVKCFIRGLGRLNVIYIIKLYRINFFFPICRN
jgi:hypothetical protein